MRYDVMKEHYTEIRLFGKPALFNDMRLDQDTVPKGLYLYEVRYDDETWEPVQIAKGILANHLGSILTRERLRNFWKNIRSSKKKENDRRKVRGKEI